MLSSLRTLLIALILLSGIQPAFGQATDYLKHGKIFCLCSIKRECFGCYSCTKERYLLKIENRTDKKVKEVYVKFYSEVYNQVLEKEAKVEGGAIAPRETGLVHICVIDGLHWIISKIVYTDESQETFTLHDRLENFHQEKDECDCNP